MDREVFSRIALNELFRQAAITWLIRYLMWFVFLGAIALMSSEFNAQSLFIAAVVGTLCIFWNRDGWIRTGRMLGLFVPAPERLQNIVQHTATKMNVSVKEVCVMRLAFAQAIAVPGSRITGPPSAARSIGAGFNGAVLTRARQRQPIGCSNCDGELYFDQ
jgi:hypothetical protein